MARGPDRIHSISAAVYTWPAIVRSIESILPLECPPPSVVSYVNDTLPLTGSCGGGRPVEKSWNFEATGEGHRYGRRVRRRSEKSGKQQRGKQNAESRDHGSPPFGAGGWRAQPNQEPSSTPLLCVLLAPSQTFVVDAAKRKKARQTGRPPATLGVSIAPCPAPCTRQRSLSCSRSGSAIDTRESTVTVAFTSRDAQTISPSIHG
jgi:hypothetical protein